MADKIKPIGSVTPVLPVSSLKSSGTKTTSTTKSVGSVQPISQTRVNYNFDIRDAFYSQNYGAGFSGETKTKQEESPKTTYSWYSTAQFMPTGSTTVATGSSAFQKYLSRFSGFEDFMKGITPSSPDEYVYVSGKGYSGLIPKSLEQYGQRIASGDWTVDYAKNMALADSIVSARNSNAGFSPLLSVHGISALPDKIKADKYFNVDYHADYGSIGYNQAEAGTPGHENYFPAQWNRNVALNKEELQALYDIAGKNMLGKNGYDELVDAAAKSKALYNGAPMIEKILKAVNEPHSADWSDLFLGADQQARGDGSYTLSNQRGVVSPSTSFSSMDFNKVMSVELSGLGELNAAISDISSKMAAGVGATLPFANQFSAVFSGSPITIPHLAAIAAIATFADLFYGGSLKAKKLSEAFHHSYDLFTPEGRLKTADQLIGEGNNYVYLRRIADEVGIDIPTLANSLLAYPQIQLVTRTQPAIEKYNEILSDAEGYQSNLLNFGDNGVSLIGG